MNRAFSASVFPDFTNPGALPQARSECRTFSAGAHAQPRRISSANGAISLVARGIAADQSRPYLALKARFNFDRRSFFTECLIPASTDTTQERWIDDHFPKRIDNCHVEWREAVHALDINP